MLDIGGEVFATLRGSRADERLLLRHARSVEEARRALRRADALAALAVFRPTGGLGPAEFEPLLSLSQDTEWIALVDPVALASRDFRAFLLRAFHDYHTLPVDAERLAVILGHARGLASLRRSVMAQPDDLGREAGEEAAFGICGSSPAMRAFTQRLRKVIDSDAPVLIGGQTGTGKELVAHAIHRHSRRAAGPISVVNCGAIPATLIQSELFGHEKSAFTGATQRKIGRIEAANGGVLFLDEIGDLPLDMQASLLRVLQERTISRVGSTQTLPVDFRVIAATHVDLAQAVRLGTFREDLFFRLNVLQLTVPALRDRGDDVLALADRFLRRALAQNPGSRPRGFSARAIDALRAHDWPGNVRELINRVQGAVVMGENRLISPEDLGLAAVAPPRESLTLDDARASFERNLLASSLRANGNKVSQTARQLGVSRVTLYRLINKLNIPLDH
ncbi:MAG: sigma-54 dependent transcriptional regulator [Betaproteobacteria bacterium]|nr:sigma-54 dependent transcriptional regulator [Betaproteobacteria bacterium]